MCLPHTWYIAADFQLYIMALAVLIPLLRWPKVGITIAVLAVVSSMLYTGLTTVLKGFPPIMLMSQPDPEQAAQFWARHYFKPFVHIGPYFIGMLAGYLLAVKPDLKIPMRILIAGWITAFIGNFSVLYGVHEWNKGADPTFWESLFYAGLGRSVWGFGVAWVIVCCVTGHGGIVNYILSMEPFIPLSRLTFSAYLLHPLVQLYYISNYRSPMYPAHMIVVWLCLGHLCITYMASLILSMLVEAPFMSLEKIIFRRGDGKTQDTAFVNNRNNLNGSLKVEKNGNIAVIIHTDSSRSIETVNTTTSEM
ncbi:nose resistant to fluoxetine protein 6 [Caerostris extrusa]|uniref:Nose resistant to fluoxetine protein 6 n=1 Tax=Caerostris extrusa TaxID=172846 RepID=A0AAV4Y7X0_CAEEX|nr:nose resistant to fluoxetine protein 6 [Caerostris extrusa]